MQWQSEKGTKSKIIIYKTLNRKLKMEHHKVHEVNSGKTIYTYKILDIMYLELSTIDLILGDIHTNGLKVTIFLII